MFSEDLSNILMMLLKDNEKYKNMIEKGFSDIDTKLISMTEKFETCNKENEQKIAAINYTINNHNYEIQALRNKVTDIETLNDSMMNSIGMLFNFIHYIFNLDLLLLSLISEHKLTEATQIATDLRMDEVEAEVNRINGTINLRLSVNLFFNSLNGYFFCLIRC